MSTGPASGEPCTARTSAGDGVGVSVVCELHAPSASVSAEAAIAAMLRERVTSVLMRDLLEKTLAAFRRLRLLYEDLARSDAG
jgi:hypothetical protein